MTLTDNNLLVISLAQIKSKTMFEEHALKDMINLDFYPFFVLKDTSLYVQGISRLT